MAYLCGNAGYVEVGITRLDVTEWTATENAKWDETTNTASAGYKESIRCLKWLSGTVSADFDAALGPFAAPDIEAGDQVAMVLHTDASGAYTFTANIMSKPITNPAGGKITWSMDFESDGAYAYA